MMFLLFKAVKEVGVNGSNCAFYDSYMYKKAHARWANRVMLVQD
ncbi:hypothetical protein VCHA50P415_120064 [Vibrio chagasii]|nr:hypothetical protein VCHA35O135_140064 [Vibrio chagasii]CAH6820979.1 hypothetical protein VCHA37O173_140054 [Vibrio chagasii]CAH6825952.1 hypothetical protein VCHA31O73_180056 [Vibrio chagasii]CAH6826600.1 hypothetical protein VCHA36P164_160058 [Vibrio chagasii]CAH6827907.1 hypothetical protein VCHA36P161_150064 [Vibrio chagasii]